MATRAPVTALRRARRGAPLLAAALAAAPWLVSALHAEIQINPKGWKFPNIVTAAKEVIRLSDRTELIPGKETILKGYRKADGTSFMTFEIEGRVYGVAIDTDGKPPFEYGIIDNDGDGKFETKIIFSKDNKDRPYVPKWVIDYYYSRHPDLKKPGAGVKPKPPALDAAPLGPPAAPPPPPKTVVPPVEVLKQPSP